MSLLNLPLDLLVLITPHLDLPSFLAFTSTCKALHSPQVREDPLFWSARVRRDFRVPNQPVVANDGKRWMKLYKRLRTQSRVYTWGNNDRQCHGHGTAQTGHGSSPSSVLRRGRMVPRLQSRHHWQQPRVSWPEEMVGLQDLGVISDLQSGGWSNTLLTAKGALYTVGTLNGMEHRHRTHPAPHPLSYPSRFAQPKDRYDSRTATRQFSAGRAHVLALSDSGKIWSWSNAEHAGVEVKFFDVNVVENGKTSGKGVVKKVVAGWNKSAALIEGTGIVVWDPCDSDADVANEADAAPVINGSVVSRADATLVLDSAVILRTGHVDVRHTKGKTSLDTQDPSTAVGEVQSFIVLENCVVFNTSLGKVFASLITWTDDRKTVSEPTELPLPDQAFVTDVQGSFQNFAIFLKSGAVLTSKQDTLMPHLTGNNGPRLWTRITALQEQGVIALAFGDYHFHALHAPGYITSYGYQPQNCGALGLGGSSAGATSLRGIRTDQWGGDGRLLPHAYTEGRRIWFERQKREWLAFLAAGGSDPQESQERLTAACTPEQDGGCQGEFSEWLEQEARNWNQKYGIEAGDDGLGAYFALGVTAAGWHSGALVLVNDELVGKMDDAVKLPGDSTTVPESSEQDNPETTPSIWGSAAEYGRQFLGTGSSSSASPTRPDGQNKPRYVWENDPFPRLHLSNGKDMPGQEDTRFDEWAFGRPEWKLDWENDEIL